MAFNFFSQELKQSFQTRTNKKVITIVKGTIIILKQHYAQVQQLITTNIANINNLVIMKQYLEDFGCGILSGVTSVISSYSFDTVKVHMQADSSLGMMTTISNIIKKQGFMELFSGIYYPLITYPIVHAFVFSSYEFYKTLRNKTQLSYLDGFENGSFAGVIVTFVVTPVELVKCRMQVNAQQEFKTSRECLKYILRTQGLKGIYRGIIPTAMREIPSYGFQFATYEFLKDRFVGPQKKHLNLLEVLCVGPLAALCSELFTYPQDVIKTRIQLDKVGAFRRTRWFNDQGVIDCAKKIYKTEGYKGFINGLKPCLLKAVLGDGIGIVVYEKCQEALSTLKQY